VATSQITGFAFVYLLRFWWPLAMLCWVSVVWVATLAIPTTWASAMRVHSRAVASAVAVVGAVLMIGATVATTAEPAELPGAAAVGAVADGMAAGLTPGGTYLVEPVGWSLFGELFGIVDALESRGFTPVADARFTIHFAPNRTEGVEGAPTTFDGTILVATSRATTDLLGTPGLVALASWDPLTPNERAEVEALWNEVRATLGAAGRDDLAAQVGDVPLETLLITGGAEDVGLDPDTRARIDELEGRGIPVTIFLAPAPDGGARGEERRR
jgi:hypothetical protein